MAHTNPTAGSSNWDVTLNQALDDIDETAEEALSGGAASVTTQQDTTSTSYTDLTTVGPSVSITLAEARTVLVFMKSQVLQASTTDDVYMSFAASGATTVAADDTRSLRHNGSGTSEAYTSVAAVSCNSGTTDFVAKYRVDGGTGRFTNRELAVVVIA